MTPKLVVLTHMWYNIYLRVTNTMIIVSTMLKATTCPSNGNAYNKRICCKVHHHKVIIAQGRIQDLIRGGSQIVTGLKLPFWGLSFVEFWCWGLIFGGQGGLGPQGPPGSAPVARASMFVICQRTV